MAKLPTGVRKRGNTYQYYFDKASIDGKRQIEYRSGFKTPKEAAAARAEAIAKYNNGGFVPLNNDISFADFSKIFVSELSENRYTLATITSYKAALNACLIPELGGYKLININRSIVNQFVNKLHNRGLSKSTIRLYICVGSKCFEVAKQHKILADNPFKGVTAPDNSIVNRGRPHQAYSDDYVKQLLTAYSGDKLETVLMIGYYAGLRVSEICALTWNDVDFVNKQLTVNKQIEHDEKLKIFYFANPKYNSIRTIDIPSVLCDYLHNLKLTQQKQQKYTLNTDRSITEGNDFSFILTNWHGKIVCKRYVITRIRQLKQKGYPAFKPHDLRHTHCTKLIDSGINMQYVQHMLGHKSLKVTLDIYTHLTSSRRKTEASKLDSAFSGLTSF